MRRGNERKLLEKKDRVLFWPSIPGFSCLRLSASLYSSALNSDVTVFYLSISLSRNQAIPKIHCHTRKSLSR